MAELTIKVPDVGEGIAEVELVSWAVTEGQTVGRNDIIAEVMTDKATVEVPAPSDGVVGGLVGTVGDVLLVGSPLFTLRTEGDAESSAADASAEPQEPAAESHPTERSATAAPVVAPARVEGVAVAAPAPGAQPAAASSAAPRQLAVVRPRSDLAPVPRPEGRKPIASPAVRRRARDAGLDLRTVTGTGPAGRIEHADLDAIFAAHGTGGGTGPRPATGVLRGPRVEVTDQPIVGIRRKIAEQMVASTSTIPHITYVEEIDMTALETLRADLNADRPADTPRLTVLPFLIRALVNELPRFPAMNAHVLDAQPDRESADPGRAKPANLRSFGAVHVGIATQTDNGLVVPVLRNAETETLWSTATRIAELSTAARSGTAPPTDMTGSTITITSLGALGGLVTTPVINKPETTIVGVNKMVTRPVWVDDRFVPRKIMNLSCSFDHRVIDGWDAANFVQALKGSMEQPALLFVERPWRNHENAGNT